MRCLAALLLGLVLSTSAVAQTHPLNVDWDSKHRLYPVIDQYRYWFGSVEWGLVVYVGTEDLLLMETELHLHFSDNKLYEGLLILGPSGINEGNCYSKYMSIVSMLRDKYGKREVTQITKNSAINELLYTDKCTPIKYGLIRFEKKWDTKSYMINLLFFGEEGEYYIEISYLNKKVLKKSKKPDKRL